MYHLRTISHKLKCVQATKNKCVRKILVNTAFKKRISQYHLIGKKSDIDIQKYIEKISYHIKEILLESLLKFNSIRVGFELISCFFNPNIMLKNVKENLNMSDLTDKNFILKSQIITKTTNLGKVIKSLTDKLNEKLTESAEQNSGWLLKHHKYLEMTISLYNPLKIKVGAYIKIPEWIKRKKCVTKIKSKSNNDCFMLAVEKRLEQNLTEHKRDQEEIKKIISNLNFKSK